jgi:hypothetical protein
LRGHDAHVQLRLDLLERGQARHQPEIREREIGRHRQHRARAARADAFQRGPDRRQVLAHGFVQHVALGRQRHAAPAAFEQRHAEQLFERGDALADGRLAGPEFVGDEGEVQVPRRRCKQLQALQG